MPQQLPDSFERILTIRLDNIGDVVMLGPALRALREAYPGAQITLLGSPSGSQAAPLLPWVDETISWRASWQEIAENPIVAPQKERDLVHILTQRHFDAAFLFTSFAQSPYPPAYACMLAGIPVRVGQSKEFGGAILSHWVHPLPDLIHQVDRNLHLLRAVEIPVRTDALELQVQPADQQRVEKLLARLHIQKSQPYLALAPGASAAARRYSEARFAEAARTLVSTTGLPILIIGGPREASAYPTLETLAHQHPRVHSLIGQTSVPEMAGLIQHAQLVLANNSSAMHISAAFHRPMVILFSGTEVLEQWAPRDQSARFLNIRTPCSPCYNFNCPYQMECLDLHPQEVAAAALALLKENLRSSPRIETSLEDALTEKP